MYDTSFCVNVLSDLLYPHLQRTEDFSEHVMFCDDLGRRLIRGVVMKNLVRFEEELKDKIPKTWKLLDFKKRTIITLLGAITYKRRIYKDEMDLVVTHLTRRWESLLWCESSHVHSYGS